MSKRAIGRHSKLLISLSVTALILVLLLLSPSVALGLTATIVTEKEKLGQTPEFQLKETIVLEGEVGLAEGEVKDIKSVTLQVTGPQPLTIDLPVTSGVHDLTASLPKDAQDQPLGKLIVEVVFENLFPYVYGYGYQGGTGGGRVKYTINYTSPIFLYPPPVDPLAEKTTAGSYEAVLKVVYDTVEIVSPVAQFTILADPLAPVLVALATIYPVGEVSALGGDLVVFQVDATDAGSGVKTVRLIPPIGDPVDFFAAADVPAVIRDKLQSAGNWLLPWVIPAGAVPGNLVYTVEATDKVGNKSSSAVTARVVAAREAFNVYLMPHGNLISFPLLPLVGDKFDFDTLMAQPVANADPAFEAALGRQATLGDIIETIFYFTGGTAATGIWKGYVPGPAFDDITQAGLFQGLWVFTKEEAFKQFPPIGVTFPETPSPIKLTLEGRGLPPEEVPPTWPVVTYWNLVGLVSERPTLVERFLRGVSVPLPKWGALLKFQNFVELLLPTVADEKPSLWVVQGVFKGLFNGDTVEPGSGFWLLMLEPGALPPVLQ